MKKNKKIFTAALLLSGFVVTGSLAYAAEGTSVVSDENDTLEEMLTLAIEDEYMARAEYEVISDEFDASRPFSRIVIAEQRHIDLLLPLFETYNIEVPVDNAQEQVVIPETIEEGFEIAIEAEQSNIKMYEQFLNEDLPEDVEDVFERLLASSQNHLRAFENMADGGACLNNEYTQGTGYGQGNGNARGNGGRGSMMRGSGNNGNCPLTE